MLAPIKSTTNFHNFLIHSPSNMLTIIYSLVYMLDYILLPFPPTSFSHTLYASTRSCKKKNYIIKYKIFMKLKHTKNVLRKRHTELQWEYFMLSFQQMNKQTNKRVEWSGAGEQQAHRIKKKVKINLYQLHWNYI